MFSLTQERNVSQHAAAPLETSSKAARACRRCGLVNTFDQFVDLGCANCQSFTPGDRASVSENTSQQFSGLICINNSNGSWVAKWLRKDLLKPGCYALSIGDDSWFDIKVEVLPVSFPSPTGQLEAGSREHRKCWTAWFNPSYQLSPPALTLSFTSCNMFKKPLVLDGVKLWFNPKDDMKPGGTSRMCCVLSPLRPSTIKAAKPFVNWESESARIIALSSITSTEIQTFEPSEIYAKLCD